MKNGDYILVKAPENFPGLKYRGKYCYEHHLIYWQKTGIVPSSNEIIHHLNGNKHDNSFENLQLISIEKHNQLHCKQRGKKLIKLKCPNCEKIFIKSKRETFLVKGGKSTFCCKLCSYSFMSITDKNEKERKIKENFVEEFVGTL